MLAIGFENFVPKEQVMAILNMDSNAICVYAKNLPQELLVSACKNRKARSLVIQRSGLAVKSAIESAIESTTLRGRFTGEIRYGREDTSKESEGD